MGTFGGVGSATSGSGLDVQSTVNQLLAVEHRPIDLLQSQQQKLDVQTALLNDFSTKLSDLLTKINALKDISGKFNTKTATSSQPGIVGVTASSVAMAGNHSITVSALATTSSYYSDALADSSTQFTSGSFDITVGGTTVTITADSTNNTLDGIAASINDQNVGVYASVITDANGARLSLVSKTEGAAGDVVVSNNTTGLSFTKAITGTNASLVVDGVPISSSSNSIGSVIPGVTLNLISAAPGTPVAVSVQPDKDQARAAVDDFVASYNALVKAINAQFTYNPSTKQAGALAGDSSLRLVQQELMNAISYTIPGNNGRGSLASIGITVENDGTLTVDGGTLDNALASDYGAVQNLFQSTDPSGFARNLADSLSRLTDATEGPLNLELKGIADSRSSLTDQINSMEDRLAIRREQLIEQYSRIDSALRQMPTLLAQINAQLAGIPKA